MRYLSRMYRIALFLVGLLAACGPSETTADMPTAETTLPETAEYAIVIHGGAGTILPEKITPEKEAELRERLSAALDRGEKILQNGGTSTEAVVATIQLLEDSPLFNAGVGAVYTHEYGHELDASIMEGHDQGAGAVAGVRTIKSPIAAALAVLRESPHVLLSGAGAEEFAETQGLEMVDNSYFNTPHRRESLDRLLEKDRQRIGLTQAESDYIFGTVGCVALDKQGNIAAGTSTGGMTNKRYGRIGDSPVIGAGTYADNNTCGVSSTGHGEYFIRYAVAYDIAARMVYGGATLAEAANAIVLEKLVEKKGSGGVIALDKYGNVAVPFNTPGMYRGYAKPGERYVGMYKE